MRRRGTVVLATSLAFLLSAVSVEAAPTRAGYEARIDRLSEQISRLDEDYNHARVELARVQRQVQETKRLKEVADQRLKSLRTTASARAAAAYRVGLPNILLILFGSTNISDFNKKLGIAARVGDWESGVVTDLRIAARRSDERGRQLQRELARAKAISESIAEKRDQLKGQVEEQERLLRGLTAPQLARRRQAVEVKVVRPPSAIPQLPMSGGARAAVQTAHSLIGRPYQWGGSGPGSFDCSGLTAYAWRAAGVSLPHSSRAQYAATQRVSREDLQPGDLVFFGRPIHHVGLYIGGGNMINSPQTGETVAIRSIARRDYVGAGRPGV
ncbi:MAG: NlpC/P60 family protein [Actinomycetota bacterium]|nr:NlpC/P60 family protein [Actinomycetota bacterium]